MNLPLDKQNRQAFERLKDEVAQGDWVAFIGSGLSSGLYPNWSELVGKLCEACGVDVNDNNLSAGGSEKLIELAGAARRADKTSYDNCLREIFGQRKVYALPIVYSYLMKIPFKSYLTLNFDPLLAEAQRIHHRNANGIHRYPSLNAMELRDRAVFYLHGVVLGDASEVQIVLGKEEFEHAYAYDSTLRTFLVQVFTFRRVCFIGCTLQEPKLQELLSRCTTFKEDFFRNRKEDAPRHVILLPEPCKVKKEKTEQHYSNMGIRVIWFDPRDKQYTGLTELLENMAELPPIQLRTGFEDLKDEQGQLFFKAR